MEYLASLKDKTLTMIRNEVQREDAEFFNAIQEFVTTEEMENRIKRLGKDEKVVVKPVDYKEAVDKIKSSKTARR
jgi:hypothetical protein